MSRTARRNSFRTTRKPNSIELKESIPTLPQKTMRRLHWVHFLHCTSDNELIIVHAKSLSPFNITLLCCPLLNEGRRIYNSHPPPWRNAGGKQFQVSSSKDAVAFSSVQSPEFVDREEKLVNCSQVL